MAKLNAKALAEMLGMPAYRQLRILEEQKYPKQQPQKFKTPYYQQVLKGIGNYYRGGNDPAALTAAKNDLQNIGNVTRRDKNLTLLDLFAGSKHSKRNLVLQPSKRYDAKIGEVVVRLSSDFQGLDKDELRIIYVNCRNVPIDDEIAAVTIEIAHWVLEQNKLELDIDQIEFLDLRNGKRHIRKTRRPKTIKTLKASAKAIQALWDSA